MSSKPDFALYGYFRSSAAFRARIALNLKGIKPELRFIHLLRNGGEQHTAEYKKLNPQELVPALVHDGHLITQSLAIIEYLDEIVLQPPFLPRDALGRARVREIAYAI
ncbi:MAG: glutathione S-transferase N-terminal domain-containing protein, partial [Alphaproteobacteria bacterium]|nr:glutathione S-transferase N-terminal domain-containing protein [Alphaproteobacteria bacterium]